MNGRSDLTVVVCTRDRQQDLARWLDCVLASAEHAGADVLVVDNDSQDKTRDILAGIDRPDFRWVRESRIGLTHARRRAIAETSSQAIVFVDDDVEVPIDWAENMAAPIFGGYSHAVAARVVLAEDLARPWLTENLRRMLAEYLDSDSPVMVGASFAVSRTLAQTVDWDDALGPGALGMSDDVLFSLQSNAAGFPIVWASGEPVTHHPDLHRLTHEAFVDLARKNGRSHAYIWHHWLGTRLRFMAARGLLARVVYATWRVREHRGIPMTDRQFEQLRRVAFYEQLSRERRKTPHYVDVLHSGSSRGKSGETCRESSLPIPPRAPEEDSNVNND